MADAIERLGASFRDPAGFVFRFEGQVYRAISHAYAPHYERLLSSGLYDELIGVDLIVPHEEVSLPVALESGVWKVIRPYQIPFVSYPYEWAPGQLQAAALLTLDVQRRALSRGMTLKDASAYNVQFEGATPVLIDTLSLECDDDRKPWVGYHQYCTHFVAPLALATRANPDLLKLLPGFLDGIPLALAKDLLPRRTLLSPGLALHLHAHAAAIRSSARRQHSPPRMMTVSAQQQVVRSLLRTVERLELDKPMSRWLQYRDDHHYSQEAAATKRALLGEALEALRPRRVLDIGANTGEYSRIAADHGARVVAVDSDVAAVEWHFRAIDDAVRRRVLPLVIDIANPSPGLGWAGQERLSFLDRAEVDLVVLLAVVHHLRVSGGIPFERQAQLLAQIGRSALVEWVPWDDTQVRRITSLPAGSFPDYTLDSFRQAFDRYFGTRWYRPVADTGRIMFLFDSR